MFDYKDLGPSGRCMCWTLLFSVLFMVAATACGITEPSGQTPTLSGQKFLHVGAVLTLAFGTAISAIVWIMDR